MANFFSADYWKAFYFAATTGTGEVEPNAMRGTFAGVASFSGTLDLPAGFISGLFVGASEFTATLDSTGGEVIQTRRRGGRGDGTRIIRRKRRTYVEFTEKRLEEIRRRERELYDDLLDDAPEVAAIVQEPPPLPVAERKSLPPAVEYERVMALMDASLRALNERATRLANEQLRKKAKAAKVEAPAKDAEQREQDLRAMVVWLDARAGWLEQQRLEAERLAQEQDEEDVIMLLLAA